MISMHLVRIGRRVVNLEFLIMYEDAAPPGAARLMLEAGIMLELSPAEANELRRLTAELIHTAEGDSPRGVVGRSVTPEVRTAERRRRKPER